MSADDLTPKQIEAIKHIRNNIVHMGRPPSIRELMKMLGSNSVRASQEILAVLQEKGIIQKVTDGGYKLILNPDLGPARAQTVDVPIIGVVACGTPTLAEQNIEGYIPISTSLAKPGSKYFLLRANGDSMDEAGINNGDLVLVKQQSFAREGDRVVALIDDEATIKELHQTKEVVILKPRSSNKSHKPIVLEGEFKIQGMVVTVIPGEAYNGD